MKAVLCAWAAVEVIVVLSVSSILTSAPHQPALAIVTHLLLLLDTQSPFSVALFAKGHEYCVKGGSIETRWPVWWGHEMSNICFWRDKYRLKLVVAQRLPLCLPAFKPLYAFEALVCVSRYAWKC